ncbi:MAG: MBG domain-containing protein, partial [Marinoscillum sp.]
ASDLQSAPELTTTATETSAVGAYAIIASGGASSNYAFEYLEGTLTVNKALLSVLVDDQERTYGMANPDLTFGYDGFVNGESASDLESAPELTTTATETSVVGAYAIIASGGASTNYAFEYSEGTLTVNKALLSVLVDDQTIGYGVDEPTHAISYSGFVNGEDEGVIEVLPEVVGEDNVKDAGVYEVHAVGGMDDHYLFEYTPGSLVVNKADLEVGVLEVMILQGDAIPDFTITYDGFKYNDDPSVLDEIPTATVDLDHTDIPGTYAIILAGGMDNNYQFVFENGVLTIGQLLETRSKDYNLVYPNPASHFFYINSEITESVEVYDLNGLLVLNTQRFQEVDVSELPSGIYLILLKGDNGKVVSQQKLRIVDE